MLNFKLKCDTLLHIVVMMFFAKCLPEHSKLVWKRGRQGGSLLKEKRLDDFQSVKISSPFSPGGYQNETSTRKNHSKCLKRSNKIVPEQMAAHRRLLDGLKINEPIRLGLANIQFCSKQVGLKRSNIYPTHLTAQRRWHQQQSGGWLAGWLACTRNSNNKYLAPWLGVESNWTVLKDK